MIEISDVPAGYAALDVLAKEADVEILGAGTVQSGHFLVSFAGEVEPVERSFARAVERAGAAVLDAVLLHHAEPRIAPALLVLRGRGTALPPQGDALGVLQTSTSPTLLRAVDAALKGADVDLVELRLGDGLGGRGLATLWGKQSDMEAAVELAEGAFARGVRQGCSAVMIANADPVVARAVASGTRFFKEHRG